MTKPSDFRPERVLEVQDDAGTREQKHAYRQIWISRLAGLALLILGWAIIAGTHDRTSITFFVETAVLVGLGLFAFAAAARTRRMAVNAEKRQRLGLLVHNMELERMAMQDDLTQLFNRRYFFERLERELKTAAAFGRPLAVIAMDLDNLKQINDTHGHRAGDEVLQNVGRFLLHQTRGSDVPARVGGDEFAVILPDTPDQQARTLMERLERRLASLNIVDREDLALKVQASFGCASFPEAGETADDVIQQADAAMYAQKTEHKRRAPEEEPAPLPSAFSKASSA